MSLNYVGKDIPRTDALKKVTGSLDFVLDRKMPGMLYGKLLRSEHARARIIDIDASLAKEMPGVFGVFTATDLPNPMPRFGSIKEDQPLLADGITAYHGEPVAIVLAESEEEALRAVNTIKVTYETLQAVSTIEDALSPEAPPVNEECRQRGTNINGEWNYNWGDVESVKKDSFYSIEDVYTFPMTHHFAIEPYACICYPEDGGVVIRSPIQHPFIMRRAVAKALNLEHSQVRVISNAIGGGFGGKGYPKIEPVAAYLALRTKRPIKITLSMNEGFFSARRAATRVNIHTGFDRNGAITYQDIHVDYLIGAYADAGPRVAAKSSYLACGPYRTPNAKIHCRAVYSNTTPSTAFRGFGMPQLIWALESQMTKASKELGIDPVQIRLRNLPEKGEPLIPGDTPVDGEWAQGLRKAAEIINWDAPTDPFMGRGIAIGIKNPIPASVSNAIAKLHADGSVTVAVGTSEMGQGARTVMGQIAAEVLGIPVERISLIMGDTSAAPLDTSTAASRSTVSMGNAVKSACLDIIQQLKKAAHELYDDGEVVVAEGEVKVQNKSISYAALLSEYYGPNLGEIVGRGLYRGKKSADHPMGGLTDFWEMVFTAVQLKVDVESGKIVIDKMVNVSDVGCAINPLQAEAQEEGAAIMGIGHSIMEHMVYNDHSRLLNGSPLDYRIPTTMDIPAQFHSEFIQNHDGPGPFGSKGLGESGIIAIAPAVAGAVSEALGVEIKELPLSPEKVWKLIQKKRIQDNH